MVAMTQKSEFISYDSSGVDGLRLTVFDSETA